MPAECFTEHPAPCRARPGERCEEHIRGCHRYLQLKNRTASLVSSPRWEHDTPPTSLTHIPPFHRLPNSKNTSFQLGFQAQTACELSSSLYCCDLGTSHLSQLPAQHSNAPRRGWAGLYLLSGMTVMGMFFGRLLSLSMKSPVTVFSRSVTRQLYLPLSSRRRR